MTKTKHALLMSTLALLLCVSMLIGSTYAWFTDSVTSTGNIIKSGTLDVTMHYADGTEAVPAIDSTDWADAASGAIFNYDKWEPGYVQVRHIKIANVGTLALKYQLFIEANGTVSELAKVIDVYYADPAVTVTGRAMTELTRLGTLEEVLAGMATSASGNLAANTNHTVTLALKMQESAGNEYQNKSIGTDFSVKLLASQLTHESDSFDETYDDAAYNEIVNNASQLAYALREGGLVKLANDIIVSESLPITKDTVLDLNGKNIGTSGSTKGCPIYLKGGKLTVKNGTLDLDGSETNVHGTFATAIGYDAQTELVVENVTFTGETAINGTFATNGPLTITVSNSTINTTNVGIAVAGESTEAIATINNCNINAGKYAIFASQGAKITINGGTYKSAENVITSMYDGSVVTVNGGYFEGNLLITSQGALVIKGGTFDADPTAWVADGYEAKNNGDGTWTVKKADIVYDKAVVGDLYTYLPTLQSGDTLILPAGTYITTGTFTIPAGVTVKGAEGTEVIIRQESAAQDDIFNCEGDVVIENITFESNRKGYAIAGTAKEHDTDGDITVINCKFKGIAADKNYGVYKNLYGNLTVKNCTFDNYNFAICGVNNAGGSTTVITDCTFTNINVEAIGYVIASTPAGFEDDAIANNIGLTADNVIGYTI